MSGVASQTSLASVDSATTESLYRKISWRILPILWLTYVLNFLDRTNLSFAQLQMKDQLGFSDTVFGLGASLTFLGLFLFEIPSNIILTRIGVRKLILGVMVLWGACTAGFAFVTTPMPFYVLRFLAGVFEGGLVPGAIYYLTLWYPKHRMGTPTAVFYTAPGSARVIAGPLAAVFLTTLNGTFELSGWQWLFILEGLPCLIVGYFTYRILADGPNDARWLSRSEKAEVVSRLSHNSNVRHDVIKGIGGALRNPMMWIVSFCGFLMLISLYGLTFWQPTLLKESGFSIMDIGLYSVIPSLLSIMLSVVIARRADNKGTHVWHCVTQAIVGAAGMSLTAVTAGHPVLIIIGLSFSWVGITSAYSLIQGFCGRIFKSEDGAAGIAIIMGLQGCAGIVGPWAIAMIKTATNGFSVVLHIMALLMTLAGVIFAVTFTRQKKAFAL